MAGTADVGTMPQTADEATNTRESQALNQFGRPGFGNDLYIALRTRWENRDLRAQLNAANLRLIRYEDHVRDEAQGQHFEAQKEHELKIAQARELVNAEASRDNWKFFSFLLALCLLACLIFAYFNAELWALLADAAYQRLLQVNALNDKIEYLLDILCIVHDSKDTVCLLDSHWFANLNP